MRSLKICALLAAVSALWFVGCDREVTETIVVTQNANCFDCHGDNGFLLQAQGEWKNSVHASGNNVDYTNRGGSDCTQCHNHKGFLEYLATGTVSAPYDSVSAIHCFTCHSPHETGDMSLRTDAPYTLINGDVFDHEEGNLCANCHHSRQSVTIITDDYQITSSRWGPHYGPQSDLLNGSNGYEFAGYSYANTAHATAIEGSCAGCHMNNAQSHAGYKLGGHSFNMADEEGNMLAGFCASCHAGVSTYDFVGADSTDYDWDGLAEGYQTEIEGMLDSLHTLLVDAGLINASTGLRITQTVADGNVVGALHNFLMVEEDRSKGSHNFLYIHGLLESSIQYFDANKSGSISGLTLLTAH